MSVKISSTLPLQGAEKLFWLHGGWLTVCHAAHLTGDQSIIVKNIRYVIPHLLRRYPRMRSRLQINGYHHLLQILDPDDESCDPNLFYSIVETNDQSWQKITEKECERNPYSDNRTSVFPLFHFKLLLNKNPQSSDDNLFHLLLLSNHSVSDGRSGYILINDFLTLVTSPNLQNWTEPVNTEVIPCIAQLVPRPHGFLYPVMSFIAKQIYKKELRKLHHPRIPVKTVLLDGESTSYQFQPIKCKFLFVSSSTTLYSRLREKCHSQQTTLHGPLFACLLLAIDHCFLNKNKKTRYLNPLNLDLDFDMRSRLPGSPLTTSTVGYCVGICSVKLKRRFPLVSTHFWTLAEKCVSATNKAVTSNDVGFIQHLLNDITKNEQTFNKFASFCPDGRVSEINFSNIGKYPYSCDYNQNQLRLHGLHVCNNATIYHTSNIVFITCVGDGQLDIALVTEIESEEKAQEFLDFYIRLIERCADADIGITLQQLLTSVEHQ